MTLSQHLAKIDFKTRSQNFNWKLPDLLRGTQSRGLRPEPRYQEGLLGWRRQGLRVTVKASTLQDTTLSSEMLPGARPTTPRKGKKTLPSPLALLPQLVSCPQNQELDP